MRTIELDKSNPLAFENYVSIKNRQNEKILMGIVVIGILAYFIYVSHQYKISNYEDD